MQKLSYLDEKTPLCGDLVSFRYLYRDSSGVQHHLIVGATTMYQLLNGVSGADLAVHLKCRLLEFAPELDALLLSQGASYSGVFSREGIGFQIEWTTGVKTSDSTEKYPLYLEYPRFLLVAKRPTAARVEKGSKSTSTLEVALNEALKPVMEPSDPNVQEVRELLEVFTRGVYHACNVSSDYCDGVLPGDPVVCQVEFGHQLDRGQEYRIRVGRQTLHGLEPASTLFCAFVPAKGFPVELDRFADGTATCEDASALQGALLEVASAPQVQATLRRFRQERLQRAR